MFLLNVVVKTLGERYALSADLTANAMDLRDKAAGAFQRTKEDLGDFMAEVEHARAAKAE